MAQDSDGRKWASLWTYALGELGRQHALSALDRFLLETIVKQSDFRSRLFTGTASALASDTAIDRNSIPARLDRFWERGLIVTKRPLRQGAEGVFFIVEYDALVKPERHAPRWRSEQIAAECACENPRPSGGDEIAGKPAISLPTNGPQIAGRLQRDCSKVAGKPANSGALTSDDGRREKESQRGRSEDTQQGESKPSRLSFDEWMERVFPEVEDPEAELAALDRADPDYGSKFAELRAAIVLRRRRAAGAA